MVLNIMNFFRPYRSDRAPSFGLVIADRMPEHKLPYRRKSEDRDETSSFYSVHTRSMIRLILGMMTPPKAMVKRRKGGRSQNICSCQTRALA
jgi:hypothetical protein